MAAKTELGLNRSLPLWQLSLCSKSRCTPWLVVCKDSFAGQLAFGVLTSWQLCNPTLRPVASSRFQETGVQNGCGWLVWVQKNRLCVQGWVVQKPWLK